MARAVDIRILGDKKLQRKLSKLQTKVQAKTMRDASKKALIPVAKTAWDRAPFKTGKMRDSLKIVVARKGVGAILKTGTRRQLGISADDPYYYPAAIEYGTNKIQPFAFLRGALHDRKPEALRILANEIRQLIAKTR